MSDVCPCHGLPWVIHKDACVSKGWRRRCVVKIREGWKRSLKTQRAKKKAEGKCPYCGELTGGVACDYHRAMLGHYKLRSRHGLTGR